MLVIHVVKIVFNIVYEFHSVTVFLLKSKVLLISKKSYVFRYIFVSILVNEKFLISIQLSNDKRDVIFFQDQILTIKKIIKLLYRIYGLEDINTTSIHLKYHNFTFSSIYSKFSFINCPKVSDDILKRKFNFLHAHLLLKVKRKNFQ